jgi:hypothetical protein
MDRSIELADLEQRLRRSADALDRQVTVRNELHRRLVKPDVRAATRTVPRGLRVTPMRLAVAAAVVVFANLPVAYFAPGYARALASAPVIGALSRPVLQSTGLTGTVFTPLDGIANSSGHTVRLISGYADSVRTVLFVSVDGKQPALGSKTSHDYQLDAYLTDQFGHRYSERYTANPSLEFEPLVWPASSVGARLTLHVDNLMPSWTEQPIPGSWTLHLTLFEETAHSRNLVPPASLSRGGFEYRITSIRLSYLGIKLHWTVAGPVVTAWLSTGFAPPGQNPGAGPIADFMRFILYDPNGKPVNTFSDWGCSQGKPGSTGPLDCELNGTLSEPGHYIFQFGTKDPTAQTAFDVPNP